VAQAEPVVGAHSHESRQDAFLRQSLEVVERSAGETGGDFDEAVVISALQMTQFLLDVYPHQDLPRKIEDLATGSQVPDLLFRELAAFKQRCLLVGQPPDGVLAERLKLRLDLLRFVHGLSSRVQLSFSQMTTLWDILDSPMERELLLSFLSSSCHGRDRDHLSPAFPTDVAVAVFRDLICKRTDWTLLGDRAYQGFSAYFTGLRKEQLDGDDGGLGGLAALWRIALTARTQSVADAASRDLLLFYSDWAMENGQTHFLKKVFQYLGECRDELRALRGNGSGQEACLKAERCLRLLRGAVGSGKQGNGSQQHSLAHGVRGQGGRRCIIIEPRKIPPQPGGVGQGVRTLHQKIESFKLYMHPLETVGAMRRKVATRCEHSVHLIRLMLMGKQLQKDEARIEQLSLYDGSEVQAILLQKAQPQVGFIRVPPLVAEGMRSILANDDKADDDGGD
jgi:hypothetical protein